MHWLDEYSIIFFDKLDSTNLEAKRLINRGAADKCLIVAFEQSLGRGRSSKFWHSPKGNLYFSIVFNHANDLANLSQLSLVVSVSCHEAIQAIIDDNELSLFPRSFKIKWPNDLLVNDKKFCGILLESLPYIRPFDNKIMHYLIIGIGINLKTSPDDCSYLTTSLKEEGIEYNSYNYLLNQIMERFNTNYKLWQFNGFSDIRYKWIKNAYNIGKKITINVRGQNLIGIFKDLNENGQMIIELDSGVIYKIATSDM